jgi:ribose transport system permease protein
MLVFALWVPDTFLTVTTLKIVLAGSAVTALVALGLTVALAAGQLDLSVAATVGISGMVSALMMVHHGLSAGPAIAIALLSGTLVGVVNAFLVAGLGVSSIIATLGTSSIVGGLVVGISGNENVVGLSQGFIGVGTSTIGGIALPVWIMLVTAGVVWFVFEHTPTGRYILATGLGAEAARLSGVSTARHTAGTLIVSATLAALAGILATARVGAGDPTLGPDYLLPAFAAAFLGSTQIKPGRFNAWGTVAAVYVLATGVQGLQLAGVPTWLPNVFNGVALLIAVGAMAARDRFGVLQRLRDRLGRRSPPPAPED